MPSFSAILTLTSLSLLVSASPLPVLRRDAAIRDSPSGQYTPSIVVCPADLAVRRPSAEAPLNADEVAYVQAKTASSVTEWSSYLTALGLADLDIATFVPSSENAVPGVTVPKIGIAISGGGSRAMLVGGGVMAALDGRSPDAVAAKTGGILQLAQYLVGLSGGSWMTGSWALANFPSFESLRDEVWDLENPLLGPETDNPEQYNDAVYATTTKAIVAPVSVVDAYGRLLSYHFFNDTDNPFGPGSATLWSSIRDQPDILSATVPLPIIVAVGRADSEENLSLSSPIYEMSPFEFGTTDPSLETGAFIPIDFLGSSFEQGQPGLSCMTGFENAGFLLGTSGNIFGIAGEDPDAPPPAEDLLNNSRILVAIGAVADIATATRIDNAFLGLSPETFLASTDEILNVVDGGLTGENVPFFPLLNRARALDVIIAVDASADNASFPDGSAIYNSYQKSLLPAYNSAPFPVIPAPEAFVAAGLNQRPVFFGSTCAPTTPASPLIVYLPNYNINYATNTSTFQNSYPVEEQASFFENSFAIATQSGDQEWAKCLGCALVDSQVARNGGARSGECEACFTRYCFA